MSSAGQLGANVAPGCDTMVIAGDIPYNNTNLQQAIHRIRRVNQPPGTRIEAIRITPRRSIITSKYDIHEDKRDRLVLRGMTDLNFDKFAHGKRDQRWRLNKMLLEDAVRVNSDGNYMETGKMRKIRGVWERACAAARTAHQPPPAEPEACIMHPELLATDLSIAPSPYPVENYVEPDPPPTPLAEQFAANRAAREARQARIEAGEELRPRPPPPDPRQYEIENELHNEATDQPLDLATDEEAAWIVADGEGEEEDEEENPPAAAAAAAAAAAQARPQQRRGRPLLGAAAAGAARHVRRDRARARARVDAGVEAGARARQIRESGGGEGSGGGEDSGDGGED